MILPDWIQSALHQMQEALHHRVPRVFVELAVVVATLVFMRMGAFLPGHLKLRKKGLDKLLDGHPEEAEKLYRKALAMGARVPSEDQIRLMVCLGDALFDQGRYAEAREWLERALAMGERSGSGQGSMCDLLLAQKSEPEKALSFADEAMRLVTQRRGGTFGEGWEAVSASLYEAKSWARKAQALILLDRRTGAREAVDRALAILEQLKPQLAREKPRTSLIARLVLGNRLQRMKSLSICAAHWEMGLALLAMRDPTRAAEHVRITRDTDEVGKYRRLAQQQLERLGTWAG